MVGWLLLRLIHGRTQKQTERLNQPSVGQCMKEVGTAVNCQVAPGTQMKSESHGIFSEEQRYYAYPDRYYTKLSDDFHGTYRTRFIFKRGELTAEGTGSFCARTLQCLDHMCLSDHL